MKDHWRRQYDRGTCKTPEEHPHEVGEGTGSLAKQVRDMGQPARQVGKHKPAQLAGAQGKIPQMFHPSSMPATCRQRFLDLFVSRSKTVDDLTEDEGYDGDRKKDIGEQVRIGECLASEVHYQAEAG